MLLAGCGSRSKDSSIQNCTPDQGTATPVPSSFDANTITNIASKLGHGITTDEVRKGDVGDVTCEKGVTKTDVEKEGASADVSVSGISGLCLVIGIKPPDGAPPKPEVLYHDVIAVCPVAAG